MPVKKVMLDSGAYSVCTKGVKIDLDDYVMFCKKYSGIDYCVNLDVIPKGMSTGRVGSRLVAGGCHLHDTLIGHEELEYCARKGYENFLRMVKVLSVEKVVPVLHAYEDISWLERYLREGCRYVGFGGIVTVGLESFWKWFGMEVSPVLDSYPGIKTHLFGSLFVRSEYRDRISSLDTAGWLRAAANGQILVPALRNGGSIDFSDVSFLYVSDRLLGTLSIGGTLFGGKVLRDDLGSRFRFWTDEGLKEEVRRVVEEFGFDLESLITDMYARREFNLLMQTALGREYGVEVYCSALGSVPSEWVIPDNVLFSFAGLTGGFERIFCKFVEREV